MAMALSEVSGAPRAFQGNPLEKNVSLRDLLTAERSVTRARLAAHVGRWFARPLPRRQKYSTGQ